MGAYGQHIDQLIETTEQEASKRGDAVRISVAIFEGKVPASQEEMDELQLRLDRIPQAFEFLINISLVKTDSAWARALVRYREDMTIQWWLEHVIGRNILEDLGPIPRDNETSILNNLASICVGEDGNINQAAAMACSTILMKNHTLGQGLHAQGADNLVKTLGLFNSFAFNGHPEYASGVKAALLAWKSAQVQGQHTTPTPKM